MNWNTTTISEKFLLLTRLEPSIKDSERKIAIRVNEILDFEEDELVDSGITRLRMKYVIGGGLHYYVKESFDEIVNLIGSKDDEKKKKD